MFSRDFNMQNPLTRRFVLTAGVSAVSVAVVGLPGLAFRRAEAATLPGKFEVVHTDEEWRKLLTPNQYAVLRHEGTERPGTSQLNHEHRAGRFSCAGCALELFSSKTKFDSGTGWPSFWQPLEHAVLENRDNSLGIVRTEVVCRRCGGHLGHVFDDGPKPSGLRYCMNGVVMTFNPGSA